MVVGLNVAVEPIDEPAEGGPSDGVVDESIVAALSDDPSAQSGPDAASSGPETGAVEAVEEDEMPDRNTVVEPGPVGRSPLRPRGRRAAKSGKDGSDGVAKRDEATDVLSASDLFTGEPDDSKN